MQHFYQQWDLGQIDLFAIPSVECPQSIDIQRLLSSFWQKALKKNSNWFALEKTLIQAQLGELLVYFQTHEKTPLRPNLNGYLRTGIVKFTHSNTLHRFFFWAERCIIPCEHPGLFRFDDQGWINDQHQLQRISDSLELDEQVIPTLIRSYSDSSDVMELAWFTLYRLNKMTGQPKQMDNDDYDQQPTDFQKQLKLLFEHLFGLKISLSSLCQHRSYE